MSVSKMVSDKTPTTCRLFDDSDRLSSVPKDAVDIRTGERRTVFCKRKSISAKVVVLLSLKVPPNIYRARETRNPRDIPY